MKTNNYFRKTLLLLLAVAGTNTAWAAAVSIPQDLGNYINWSNATSTATAENTGNADGGNLGSTAKDKYATFSISNKTEQDYVLSFRSSSNSCVANWTLTMTNSSSVEVLNKTFAVVSTSSDNWNNYSNVYSYLLKSLPADTYTLTFTCTEVTAGSYGGNLKYLAFNKASDFSNMPLAANSEYLSFANGTATTTGNPRYVPEGNIIGWIPSYGSGEEAYPNNAFIDSYFFHNNTSGYYTMKFFLNYANNEGNKAKIKVTITDVESGINEIDGVEYNVTYSGDDKSVVLANHISKGLKKIRFDFCCKSSSCNFKNVNFVLDKYVLSENESFTPVAADGVDVVLTRSIPADKWATLCLPFSMDNATLKATYGDDVKIANFTAYNSSTKALTFNQMSNGTDAITANTPCLIKVSEKVSGAKTINGVNIVTTGDQYVVKNGVRFQGVYTSTEMVAGNYFVSGGNLYKATANTRDIKPFRAYFTGVEAGARMAVDDGFGDVTYIDMPHVNGSAADGKCYNLQGQRVEQPTKGIYVKDGRKVIIK